MALYNHSSEDMFEVTRKSTDLVVTSPPYNINTQYDDYNDSLYIEQYTELMKRVIKECIRVVKDDGYIIFNVPEFAVVNSTIYFYPKLYEDLMRGFGYYLQDSLFWVKVDSEGAISPSHKWSREYSAKANSIHSVTEWIMVFNRGKKYKKGGSVLYLQRNSDKSKHPAAWPIELPISIIKGYSSENDTVLDPFMGIGTTGEACLALKRKFIGYEVSDEYFNIVKNKLKEKNK